MDKYIDSLLSIARSVGRVETCSMTKADKWFPAKVTINGISESGEPFSVELSIGEKLSNDS